MQPAANHPTGIPLGYDEHGCPILPAFEDECGHLRVWCNPCGRWHLHGMYEGHRYEHCIDPHSAYRRKGYVLETVAVPFTDEFKSRVEREARALRICAECDEQPVRGRCRWCGAWRHARCNKRHECEPLLRHRRVRPALAAW